MVETREPTLEELSAIREAEPSDRSKALNHLMERDFVTNPYSPDEQRAADYIVNMTGGLIGAGDDPIGFLFASHQFIVAERKAMLETWHYLWRWVERGLFDRHHTPKDALELMSHYPTAPWNNGRWDVDHKDYGEAFYKAFPKAKGE